MSVIAVVPAAGRGERFGGNKLLARIKGEPLIDWTLWSLLDGGVTRVIVVTAPSTDLTGARMMADSRVRFVVNPDPSIGMLSSIQTGVAAADRGDPILILPGDMPFVASSTVTAVTVACIRQQCVVVPTFNQRHWPRMNLRPSVLPGSPSFPVRLSPWWSSTASQPSLALLVCSDCRRGACAT